MIGKFATFEKSSFLKADLSCEAVERSGWVEYRVVDLTAGVDLKLEAMLLVFKFVFRILRLYHLWYLADPVQEDEQ